MWASALRCSNAADRSDANVAVVQIRMAGWPKRASQEFLEPAAKVAGQHQSRPIVEKDGEVAVEKRLETFDAVEIHDDWSVGAEKIDAGRPPN